MSADVPRSRAIDGTRQSSDHGWMFTRLIVLAAVCAGVTACTAPPSLPKLDEQMVRDMAGPFETIVPEQRPMLAARDLAELERGRLDDALIGALESQAAFDPVKRVEGVAAGLASADARGGWERLCRTPHAESMQEFGELAPAERTRRLVAACDLERTGLAPDPAHIDRIDGLTLTIAIVTYGALERAGDLHPFERKALVALAATPIGPFDPERGPPPLDLPEGSAPKARAP